MFRENFYQIDIKIIKNFLDKIGVSYTGLGDHEVSQACNLR